MKHLATVALAGMLLLAPLAACSDPSLADPTTSMVSKPTLPAVDPGYTIVLPQDPQLDELSALSEYTLDNLDQLTADELEQELARIRKQQELWRQALGRLQSDRADDSLQRAVEAELRAQEGRARDIRRRLAALEQEPK